MRRIATVATVVIAVFGASNAVPASGASKHEVITSFYPLAYAAQEVGGGNVEVKNLTPAGAEPHDLELTPTSGRRDPRR